MSHVTRPSIPESPFAEAENPATGEGAQGGALEGIETTPSARSADTRVGEAIGRLVRIEGSTFVVRIEEGAPSGEVRAQRAVSCLVEPEVDDVVLVALRSRGGSTQQSYVLAVLERTSPNAAVSCSGDLELRLKEGRFRVASQKGIDLVSPEGIDVVSNRVSIHANTAKIVSSSIVALASQVVGDLTSVKLTGSILDKVFDRVSERVQRSIRKVEEIEQVRAKQIEITAEQTLALRSDNTIVTAKEIVKNEGPDTHFG